MYWPFFTDHSVNDWTKNRKEINAHLTAKRVPYLEDYTATNFSASATEEMIFNINIQQR